MISQIFKQRAPLNILYNLLDLIALKKDNYYTIDMNSYKKMIYNNYHIKFCEELKSYYHDGKQFYLERKITYTAFTTILRQLCKHGAVMFTSKINFKKTIFIYYRIKSS